MLWVAAGISGAAFAETPLPLDGRAQRIPERGRICFAVGVLHALSLNEKGRLSQGTCTGEEHEQAEDIKNSVVSIIKSPHVSLLVQTPLAFS